jgi:hypothetical protein
MLSDMRRPRNDKGAQRSEVEVATCADLRAAVYDALSRASCTFAESYGSVRRHLCTASETAGSERSLQPSL